MCAFFFPFDKAVIHLHCACASSKYILKYQQQHSDINNSNNNNTTATTTIKRRRRYFNITTTMNIEAIDRDIESLRKQLLVSGQIPSVNPTEPLQYGASKRVEEAVIRGLEARRQRMIQAEVNMRRNRVREHHDLIALPTSTVEQQSSNKCAQDHTPCNQSEEDTTTTNIHPMIHSSPCPETPVLLQQQQQQDDDNNDDGVTIHCHQSPIICTPPCIDNKPIMTPSQEDIFEGYMDEECTPVCIKTPSDFLMDEKCDNPIAKIEEDVKSAPMKTTSENENIKDLVEVTQVQDTAAPKHTKPSKKRSGEKKCRMKQQQQRRKRACTELPPNKKKLHLRKEEEEEEENFDNEEDEKELRNSGMSIDLDNTDDEEDDDDDDDQWGESDDDFICDDDEEEEDDNEDKEIAIEGIAKETSDEEEEKEEEKSVNKKITLPKEKKSRSDKKKETNLHTNVEDGEEEEEDDDDDGVFLVEYGDGKTKNMIANSSSDDEETNTIDVDEDQELKMQNAVVTKTHVQPNISSSKKKKKKESNNSEPPQKPTPKKRQKPGDCAQELAPPMKSQKRSEPLDATITIKNPIGCSGFHGIATVAGWYEVLKTLASTPGRNSMNAAALFNSWKRDDPTFKQVFNDAKVNTRLLKMSIADALQRYSAGEHSPVTATNTNNNNVSSTSSPTICNQESTNSAVKRMLEDANNNTNGNGGCCDKSSSRHIECDDGALATLLAFARDAEMIEVWCASCPAVHSQTSPNKRVILPIMCADGTTILTPKTTMVVTLFLRCQEIRLARSVVVPMVIAKLMYAVWANTHTDAVIMSMPCIKTWIHKNIELVRQCKKKPGHVLVDNRGCIDKLYERINIMYTFLLRNAIRRVATTRATT